jgi:beta-glucosidase/6-phospho-beta-glucosidase/beta-galactosidase
VVRLDRSTQERIPKLSASWYRDTIAVNAIADGPPHVSRRLA